jgi:Flp pilus assembly protein protease CpaA
MLDKLLLLLFPLLMAFAASSDLLTMRISNRVVLLLVAIFCAVAVGIGMPLDEFGLHVACATIVLIVAFAMFASAGSAAAMPSWPPRLPSGSALASPCPTCSMPRSLAGR